MLTAGEEVKIGLQSNGEEVEKWREMDKKGCKRSEGKNGQRELIGGQGHLHGSPASITVSINRPALCVSEKLLFVYSISFKQWSNFFVLYSV